MKLVIFVGFFMVLCSCEQFEPPAPAGDATLDGPLPGLTPSEVQQFHAGDQAFNDQVFTIGTGLGPLFVATSCGGCHPNDGKGHPFTTLTRFGQADEQGNQYLATGGPQLQQRAIAGFEPEAIPPGATFSKFTPPANTGLGFVDAVSDAEILSWADPDDEDHDGISGSANWIVLKSYSVARNASVTQNGKYPGRFGKKASTYDLVQQTATAYNQDIGIVSVFEPIDTYSKVRTTPEIEDQKIYDVVAYLKTLKAPQPRQSTAEILQGRDIFFSIGCNRCHRPEMKTGPSTVSALSDKTFYPFSDLLLHDMGPELDDGYTEGSAKSFEWRTPPLWGLGLSKRSQGGQYYLLHDGRARNIQEAILLHGGEALVIKQNFSSLPPNEAGKLIEFLESL